MSANSKIEWTHHTFNPIWGCTKVSPACDHCYAETFSKRVGFSETGSQFPIWGKDARRRTFGDKHWNEPLEWNRKAMRRGVQERVFCGSMCDVMEDHEEAATARQRLYPLIEATPYLNWMLLTKRPQNFRRFLPKSWLEHPRPNVWGLTTVENSDYLWRVQALAETPFVVRGLSMEPLLGPVDLTEFFQGGVASEAQLQGSRQARYARIGAPRIHWVITGGESGPGARPSHPEWFRSLRDQCVAAGVAFHFKQWGNWGLAEDAALELRRGATVTVPSEPSPGGLQRGGEVSMQRLGRKNAGRLLDGVLWDQLPR